MNYLTSLLKELVAKRKLIWELSKADFRKRFVGSYFGVVWMFIQPIVTVLIYWLIFGPIGFKSAPPVPNASYVQWLVPGIAPYFFAGIDFATTMLRLSFGSPPIQDGISRRSGSPSFTRVAASQERKALFTST